MSPIRSPVVIRFARPFLAFAVLGAMALALAACGLKGSLDPPPAATAAPGQLEGQPTGTTPPAEGETPPQSPRKRIFLDWLLD